MSDIDNSITIGIDFGGNNYVLSGYDNRIEPIVPKIVEDVYSQKKTQLFIDMTNNRLFGKSTTAVKNFKNVITTIKDLFGKKFSETSEILKNHSHYPESIIEIENDEIGFRIHNIGLGEKILNVNDIYSSYANHIYEYIKEKNNMDKIKCILSVPCDYNNYQIELLRRIFESNGFKKVEIIPEYLSCSLCFGYENDSKFVDEESKKKVLFVDMGYLKTNICLNEYGKNEVKIIQTKTINDLCGMRIDNILINHFREIIEDKMKIDIFEVGKEKNYLKVKNEIIKMKEKLSAQGASDINVSIDLGDDDFDSTFSVNELNDLVKKNGIDKELKEGIKAVLNESKISNEEKRLIEVVIVGGSLRIPLLQTTIEEYLKSIENETKINRTINMDEDISYGNSYYGLIEEGKWKYRIVNEDNEDVMNNIISIPELEIETELKCLNYLMLNIKRKKIKEDDKEILRQMDDCIIDEMNKLKDINEGNEINVDEMKKRIERIESKLKEKEISPLLNQLYTLIKKFQIILSKPITKSENVNRLIKIIENNYNYIHNEIEVLSNGDEIVKKSRKTEIEFYYYDKNYGNVMKKRNDLESSIYEYQRIIDENMKEMDCPFLNDFKTYLKESIEPLHKMMRKELVDRFDNELNERKETVINTVKEEINPVIENIKSDLGNVNINNDEIKNELRRLFESIDQDKLENLSICEYYDLIPKEYNNILEESKKNVKDIGNGIINMLNTLELLPDIKEELIPAIEVIHTRVDEYKKVGDIFNEKNVLKGIREKAVERIKKKSSDLLESLKDIAKCINSDDHYKNKISKFCSNSENNSQNVSGMKLLCDLYVKISTFCNDIKNHYIDIIKDKIKHIKDSIDSLTFDGIKDQQNRITEVYNSFNSYGESVFIAIPNILRSLDEITSISIDIIKKECKSIFDKLDIVKGKLSNEDDLYKQIETFKISNKVDYIDTLTSISDKYSCIRNGYDDMETIQYSELNNYLNGLKDVVERDKNNIINILNPSLTEKVFKALQDIEKDKTLLSTITVKQDIMKDLVNVNEKLKNKCRDLLGNSCSNELYQKLSDDLNSKKDEDLDGILVLYNSIVEAINTEKNNILDMNNEYEVFKKKAEYIKNEEIEKTIHEIIIFPDKTTLSKLLENEDKFKKEVIDRIKENQKNVKEYQQLLGNEKLKERMSDYNKAIKNEVDIKQHLLNYIKSLSLLKEIKDSVIILITVEIEKNNGFYDILKNKTIVIPNLDDNLINTFLSTYDDFQALINGTRRMDHLTTYKMFNSNLDNCRTEIRRCIARYYSEINEVCERIKQYKSEKLIIEIPKNTMEITKLIEKYKSDEKDYKNEIVEIMNKQQALTKEDVKIFEETDFGVISFSFEELKEKKEELTNKVNEINTDKYKNQLSISSLKEYEEFLKCIDSFRLSIIKYISSCPEEKKSVILKGVEDINKLSLHELLKTMKNAIKIYKSNEPDVPLIPVAENDEEIITEEEVVKGGEIVKTEDVEPDEEQVELIVKKILDDVIMKVILSDIPSTLQQGAKQKGSNGKVEKQNEKQLIDEEQPHSIESTENIIHPSTENQSKELQKEKEENKSCVPNPTSANVDIPSLPSSEKDSVEDGEKQDNSTAK